MKKYLVLLFVPFLMGAAPVRVNNFSDATTIRSDEVNTDFNNLYGYLQTGIDNVRTSGIDAITEFSSSIRSGADQTLITGTEGSSTQFAVWNSDGDLVGISTMTGNTSGIKISTAFAVTGLVGIGTTTPRSIVDIDKGTGVGQVTIDGSTGACLMLRDTDDAGWTECDALDGTLTCSVDADGICD